MKNKHSKILVAFLIMNLLLFGVAIAQSEEIATAEDVKTAEITPDSPFYGIELAFDKIAELFSENAKLSHAMERLAEVKVMISQNKLSSAEKAINEFEVIRLNMKNASKIEEHKKLIDNLGQKISEIASGTNNLTEQDRTEIKELIEEHKENVLSENRNLNNIIKQNSLVERLFPNRRK